MEKHRRSTPAPPNYDADDPAPPLHPIQCTVSTAPPLPTSCANYCGTWANLEAGTLLVGVPPPRTPQIRHGGLSAALHRSALPLFWLAATQRTQPHPLHTESRPVTHERTLAGEPHGAEPPPQLPPSRRASPCPVFGPSGLRMSPSFCCTR